ncbi:RidA family protein [Halorientalis brevis]|uniref:RidA family protein n=1 Tax=Halorientalis brevis TaxID=1126241 RepID=A0ABD6CA12_9EURY|nr:RidA family protein [Halorientalis brevis]
MERRLVSSGTDWEDEVGYSRAVRAGDAVHVSGTTAIDDDGDPLDAGPYEQTKRALDLVADALAEAGASVEDVVRTRMYVTDIDAWEEIGRAHGEVFGDVKPATTMVEVERLIDPALVVEIEAEASIAD